uniref:Macaca fascicularis brain cDNA clone: QorA-10847, similar to human beta-2-microglobulin (B2M), mRNA, RefSeq: NM_004048.2 n=1 Tax=Macaca fascicularis TaxID=9541 RepID=I7G976_MACFA|nr:unnamed protein product [Macaca fascicularis]
MALPVPPCRGLLCLFATPAFISQLHPKTSSCLLDNSTQTPCIYVFKIVFMTFPPKIFLLLNHLLIKGPSTLMVWRQNYI